MSQKRSRAAFEADLQAQQSPYVVYGTALPPTDPDVRDDGSYVPVWKQEVRDEQGRKRLHGAFTGGFSAGYFNTVGSKEGWTPSTFVSSRSNRRKDDIKKQQRPEDFMDDEDIAEAEENQRLENGDDFAGLGSTEDPHGSRQPLMDIFKTAGDTMGVKLLMKMGWRQGQGIGPKRRRAPRLEDGLGTESQDGDDTSTLHLFAPENSEMISFNRKDDRKGLGFATERRLESQPHFTSASSDPAVGGDEEGPLFRPPFSRNKREVPPKRGGMGVGVLNDEGSDDDDAYSMGPKMSYNRVIGGSKKKKDRQNGLSARKTSANPMLNNKPVFISKKAMTSKDSGHSGRCHDGRLPLTGFILSSLSATPEHTYPPPSIPDSWKSVKSSPRLQISGTAYKSTAEAAAMAGLSPKSRAALLGETQLPGKSVFDFLTPAARSRIAAATNKADLPPARSEGPSASVSCQPRTLSSLVPALDSDIALTALGRGTAGWMPYTEDPAKMARYRAFLEVKASLRPAGTIPDRALGASNDEWANEMTEFARAAQVFKPMTGSMASRFTSSSSAPKLASDNLKSESDASQVGEEERAQLIKQPQGSKVKSAAQEAAAMGMYGPLTRSITLFYPNRLLCKRFNVKPPIHVQQSFSNGSDGVDPLEHSKTFAGGQNLAPPTHSTALPQKQLELIGQKDMEAFKKASREHESTGGSLIPDDKVNDNGQITSTSAEPLEGLGKSSIKFDIDPERNEALEVERPGEAVFKAIFGSDSEDE